MNNKELMILCIASIIALIILYRQFKQKSNFTTQINKVKKHVRFNPLPVFEHVMGKGEKFYETIPSTTPKTMKVILCYADWCGQCAKVKPIFKELRDENRYPNVKFIMTEENDDGPNSKYHKGLRYYPVILTDINGKIEEYTGKRSKIDIIKYIISL